MLIKLNHIINAIPEAGAPASNSSVGASTAAVIAATAASATVATVICLTFSVVAVITYV